MAKKPENPKNPKTHKNPFDNVDLVYLSSSPAATFSPKPMNLGSYTPATISLLDTESEWQAIKGALRGADAKLRCMHAPLTKTALKQVLLADPKILMIAGHASGQGNLCLVDTNSEVGIAQELTKKKLFDDMPSDVDLSNLQLVCLSTCHSGMYADFFYDLYSLAVPHVVCVDKHSAVNDRLAPVFFGTFFRKIFEGKGVSDAFKKAQSRLKAMDPQTHGLKSGTTEKEAHVYELWQRGEPYDSDDSDDEDAAVYGKKEDWPTKFEDLTTVVPHNTLPAFARHPEWGRWFASQRDTEVLNYLQYLVGECSVVLLCGPAGMGKSTVAQRITTYAFGRRLWFNGGVFYFSGRHSEKELLGERVAHSLAAEHKRLQEEGRKEFAIPELPDPAKAPWRVIKMALTAWASKATPVLLVLDDMDKKRVLEAQLTKLLETVAAVNDGKRLVRVLVTRRNEPKWWKGMVAKLKLNATTERLKKIEDDKQVYQMLCVPRPTDNAAHVGPWEWWGKMPEDPDAPDAWAPSKEELQKANYALRELIRGNPGMMREARKVAVLRKVDDPSDLEDAWEAHFKLDKLGHGGLLDDSVNLQLFDQGYVSAEDGAAHAGGSGWHSGSDDDDDDYHLRQSRRRRRRRHGHRHRRDGQHCRERRVRRHRHRRARNAVERRRSDLREEHQRLLAENRELTSTVREIESVLRRALCV